MIERWKDKYGTECASVKGRMDMIADEEKQLLNEGYYNQSNHLRGMYVEASYYKPKSQAAFSPNEYGLTAVRQH